MGCMIQDAYRAVGTIDTLRLDVLRCFGGGARARKGKEGMEGLGGACFEGARALGCGPDHCKNKNRR